MRKIIFLDIDGVFNCQNWYAIRKQPEHVCEHPLNEFWPEAVNRFNKIIEATNAEIVISSTWRSDGIEKLKELFSKVGIKGNIIDVTPNFRSDKSVRGNEIYYWIDKHLTYPWHAYPETEEKYKLYNEDGSFKMMNSCKEGVDYTYCIIDDDSDMLLWQANNFVHTSWIDGLKEEHVERAISILNKI